MRIVYLDKNMESVSLSGFRFIKMEFGLVADLMFKNPCTTQFYTMFEFHKGTSVVKDIFCGNDSLPNASLQNLGKIVKVKCVTEGKTTYTFTDDSWTSIG